MHRSLALSILAVIGLHVCSAAAHPSHPDDEMSNALETFLHSVEPRAVIEAAQVVERRGSQHLSQAGY